MRIGVYFGDFNPDVGGAYTFVADILDAVLDAAGGTSHHFTLFCTSRVAELLRLRPLPKNLNVTVIGSISRSDKVVSRLKYLSPMMRFILRRPGRLERLAHGERIEVIWFVGVGVYESTDIPYIATIWDLQHRLQPFFPELSSNGLWDKRELVLGYFLRRAALCITGTDAGKKEIEKFYQLPGRSIEVIPLPTPRFALGRASSKADRQAPFGLNGKFIVYPAQFWPHKNHVNLLLALKKLRDNHGMKISLVLPGSDKGNLAFVKRQATDLGLDGQVLFPGFVSSEELIELYETAEALVFPSYFGPDNIPPLEAFGLSCPVIAANVDGAKEQYGDAAILVDPSRPEEIAEAINAVLSSAELRDSLVSRGLERASRWSAAQYFRTMLEVFDRFSAIRRNWP